MRDTPRANLTNAEGGQEQPEGDGGRAARARKQDLLLRLLGLAWRYRRRCFVALFWALLVQALMLSAFLFSGLAIDVVRQAAVSSPTSTVEPAAGLDQSGTGLDPGIAAADDAARDASNTAPAAAEAVDWPLGLSPPANWSLMHQLVLAAGLVLLFSLLRGVATYLARVTDERLVQDLVTDLRTSIYDKLQAMSFGFFDTQDSGTLINRATADASSVRMFIQMVLIRLLVAVASLALFLTWMFQAHALLTLSVLVVFPLQFYLMIRYARTIRPQFKQVRESMDEYIQTLEESIEGVRMVKGFGQERQVVRRYTDRNDHVRDSRLGITRLNAVYMPGVPATGFLQLAILLAYGGYLVKIGPVAGGIALGTMWVFLSLLRQLAAQIDLIVNSASTIPDALTAAERVFELLDAPVTIASPVGGGHAPDVVRGEVRFENVTFRYGESGPIVLENVTFTVRPGETVALVGPAGSGKTTLLKLIPRFYDPLAGRITVDGVDLREWNLERLRRATGVVFQEPFLFSNTIRANIAFGRMDIEDAVVAQAATDAAALDFIERAPARMETIIGERGVNLSGGERQRLTLARALVLSPAILLLDDATAAVDAKTEVRIQEALDRIMRERTTIVIAHRLSTLRRADRIIVIEGGRITGEGTHDGLMARNAHYRRAAELQLERELPADDVRLTARERRPGRPTGSARSGVIAGMADESGFGASAGDRGLP